MNGKYEFASYTTYEEDDESSIDECCKRLVRLIANI